MIKQICRRSAAFLLLAIIFITSTGITSFAAEIGETVYISTSYRAQQGSDSGTTNANAAGVYWHGNTSVRFITTRVGGERTGVYVYCIEPGAEFENNTYTANNLTDSVYWQRLSQEAQRGITYTTMYGFPVNQFGVSKCDAYAASQAIIWEFVLGYRTLSGRTNRALFDDMIAGTLAENAYYSLESSVINHSKIPSFSQRTQTLANENKIKLNYNSGTFSVTLTDTTGVLSGYNVTAADGLNISKNGNSITISSTTHFDLKTINLERPLPQTGQGLLALDSGSNQRCLVGQLQDPVRNYVSFYAEEPFGNLSILKTSQHNNGLVEGFSFEVRNPEGTLLGTFKTDNDGKINIPDLQPGTYSVKEVGLSNEFVEPKDNPKSVTIVAGQTATVTFDNIKKRGVITVRKTDANPTMGGYSLDGAVFEVRDQGGTVVDTITTGADGKAQTQILPLGIYSVKEIKAPYGFVVDTNEYTASLSGSLGTSDVVYAPDVTIAEQPQVGTITVTKLDATTSSAAQGDSSLNGAVFEVFKSDKTTLVDTIYCGTGSSGTTKELSLGTYYVKEKISPKGYTLDPSWHEVKIEYAGQDVPVVRVNADVKNKVIEGQIAITKHTDEPDPDVSPTDSQIEQPLENAVFEVFLKSAGSHDKAKETERDLLTTDENGYAITKLLPYGVYTVREIEAPGDVKLVEPFDVFVSQEGKIYRYILNDLYFRSLVKIVKKDAETGVTIPLSGTSFKVKDLSTGKFVVQHINYPTPIDIDVFETAPDGSLIMPEPLKSGDYELHEVAAPYGYVISKEPVKFTISSAQADPTIIEVIMANMPVNGTISVEKKGDMFTDITVTETEFGEQHTPIFSETGLSGAVFDIIAAEDIITPDGTVRAKKDDVVDTITTDGTGHAASEELYLGNYFVVETTAPTDFVLDKIPHPVSLVYENQEVSVVSSQIGLGNARQQVAIDLQKYMETPPNAPAGFNPLKDVVFGLFADEDILTVKGDTSIPKDGLITLIFVDDNGYSGLTGELPFAKYYLKELCTNAAYELSEVIYPIDVKYAGQEREIASFTAFGGMDIPNTLKFGQLTIEKQGEMLVGANESQSDSSKIYQPIFEEKLLNGAVFDVTAAADIIDISGEVIAKKGDVLDTITTGEDGRATTILLHLGEYELIEKAVPFGVVSGGAIPVTLGVEGEITEVVTKFVSVHNERQRAELLLTKVMEMPENPPENYNPYASVQFGLCSKKDILTPDGEAVIPAGALLEIFGVDADGKAKILTDLPFGEYFVKEIATANGYVLDEHEYPVKFDYVPEKDGVVSIKINDGKAIENKLLRGNVRLIKQDGSGKKALSGAEFELYDPSGKKLGTYTTDKKGEILVGNLPYGAEYSFVEVKAPAGYKLDKTPLTFDIAENGATVTISAVNEKLPDAPNNPKTGDDFAAWPWLSLAAVSLGGVIALIIIRKKKKDEE